MATKKQMKKSINNARKQNARKFLTNEQKAAIRARDSLRKRLRRAALSFDELLKLREKEALQKRLYRQGLSPEQLVVVRNRDAERKRLERSRIGVMKKANNETYITKKKSKRKPEDGARNNESMQITSANNVKQQNAMKTVTFS